MMFSYTVDHLEPRVVINTYNGHVEAKDEEDAKAILKRQFEENDLDSLYHVTWKDDYDIEKPEDIPPENERWHDLKLERVL